MSTPTTQNSEKRAREKFFSKLRSELDDLKVGNVSNQLDIVRRQKEVADEEIYGLVTKEEFLSILSAYDQQQNNANLEDKPVKSDDVTGQSFAKLLFSKPGLHHPGATEHLVKDLEIDDVYRNSFLGGHSTYEIEENETIDSVRKRNDAIYIQKSCKELFESLNEKNLSETFSSIEEIARIDRHNPNVLAVYGKLHLINKHYQQAIDDMKRAIDLGCDHQEIVKKEISRALAAKGFGLYGAKDYRLASDYFMEALQYDSTNAEAELHFRMCNANSRPFGDRNSFANYRR